MTDLCSLDSDGLLSLDEALERIRSGLEPVVGSEKLPLANASGRITVEALHAPIDLPYEANAAMDGYAFSSSDGAPGTAFSLELAGTSWAGRPFQGRMQPGQTIRIFTGAVVPPEADSIVMQEQVKKENSRIVFPANIDFGGNIRQAGEDIRQGSLLCSADKPLSAYDIALLASAGIDWIIVRRKVNIIFFSTGDELTPVGEPLTSGKIYDSNRYLLAELLLQPCFEITDGGILKDDKDLLQTALMRAAENYDVIITTGGASVGDADYIKDILLENGRINFWKLALKPGKPLAVGKLGDCYLFGLPGNPISVVVTFQQVIAPALAKLAGAPDRQRLRLNAVVTAPLKKSPGRMEFQRGILSQTESGDFRVAPAGHQGAHILGSMSKANCFIVLPTECGNVEAGRQVMVEPLTLLL
jgi:molybdopterin molybdotransferase